jgi:Rap1a immunity proteins
MKAIVAAAFVALSVTAAWPQQDVTSASDVLPGCKFYVALADGQDPKLTVPIALAAGYCAAVLDVLVSSWALDPVMCLDSDIDKATAMLVFIRYIEARPQRMGERFLVLAREALRQAWPCVRSFGRQ